VPPLHSCARRHADAVGYILGYGRRHGSNLAFDTNCLRQFCDSDPSLQNLSLGVPLNTSVGIGTP
jgi:hypothetical protein